MRKLWKSIYSFGLPVLALGAVLWLAGFMMGGRPAAKLMWRKGGLALTQSVSQAQASAGNQGAGRAQAQEVGAETVTRLVLDIENAAVVIHTGSSASVEVQGTDVYTSRFADGTWTIEATTGNLGKDVTFTVTLPEGKTLEELSLRIGAGTLNAQGLACETADLEVGAGTMTLTNFTCTNGANMEVGMGTLDVDGTVQGKSSLHCGMGRAQLVLQKPADFGYSVDCGMGSVRVDGNSYAGIGVKAEQNASAANFMAVDCGMGSVEVEFA